MRPPPPPLLLRAVRELSCKIFQHSGGATRLAVRWGVELTIEQTVRYPTTYVHDRSREGLQYTRRPRNYKSQY